MAKSARQDILSQTMIHFCSKEEKIELAKKEREIKHENTRFTANPWKSKVQSEDVLKTMVAKQEASLGKVGTFSKVVKYCSRFTSELNLCVLISGGRRR